jgi:carboxyl-terminal processing protease
MYSRRSRRTPTIVLVIAAVVILVAGIWIGGHASFLPTALRGNSVDDSNSKLVHQVLTMLSQDYYRPVNTSNLTNSGLEAAVASLNDPYSHYFDPTEYDSFQNTSNPHLSGIGIDVYPQSNGLRVVDVFPESPAATSGLMRGDVIIKVGNTALSGKNADTASALIKGPAGTKVTLTVLRGKKQMVITITRADIVVPVATGEIVKYHGVKLGDLQFTSFTQGSGDQLRQQVTSVMHQGARGLILDLRENGGGLLDEAVNVASIFIPDGTIVTTRGRSQPTQVYLAKGNAIAPSIPLVVLVDRGTASAAEIVTGALQDRRRALVVGTHTYGKGVFQEINPLPNGGALDITVGEYFTPNGHNLGGGGVREGAGITPNIFAQDNPKSPQDEALQVAEKTVASEVER